MQEAAASAALALSLMSSSDEAQWLLEICRAFLSQGRPREALAALHSALVARGCGEQAQEVVEQ